MITNCKRCINGNDPPERIWEKGAEEMMENLESCLRLNEAYQEQYRMVKEKLLTMPKGKQFDFSEAQLFSKFDLFCRRVIKLLDMFATIAQFRLLANNHLEGMEGLIASFFRIIQEFKSKRQPRKSWIMPRVIISKARALHNVHLSLGFLTGDRYCASFQQEVCT